MHRPAFILIDEPEMNLHPALQLDFLTTLGSYATDGVVFATHHLGLARSASERIYALSRVDGLTHVNKYEELTSLAEFLGALTFSGHSELGFSKVLLVEGTSEIKTIQQFLRLNRKEHEVVLLSLGGAGLIKPGVQHELAEIVRITPNVAALIDSERAFEAEPLESAREGFASDCAAVGIRCHVLERRSLENYFTEQAINSLYGPGAAALGPYDPTPPGWKKADNWRIARSMSQADIANTDLGHFLASL